MNYLYTPTIVLQMRNNPPMVANEGLSDLALICLDKTVEVVPPISVHVVPGVSVQVVPLSVGQ
jgi:hypothetical protein